MHPTAARRVRLQFQDLKKVYDCTIQVCVTLQVKYPSMLLRGVHIQRFQTSRIHMRALLHACAVSSDVYIILLREVHFLAGKRVVRQSFIHNRA
jgi:hypothetical protein